jgi:chemotaxis methyl-accepting protein methylase
MDDQQFRQLLSRFGFSWDGYRKVRKGVKKRVSRHMQQMGCRTVQAYLLELDQHKDARQHFEHLMTVSISRFFRDRALWQTLEDEVLPRIIKEHENKVKVWSAGCACGEEVYSLKILWEITGQRLQALPELEIWGTDMNPLYLNKARAGVYGRSSLKEVPEALRAQFFRVGSMKEGIVWLDHNLLFDPSGNKFRLVFLRNSLLTYYEERLKGPAFQKVVDALAEGGFLIIGSHEQIPPRVGRLLPFGRHPCIYQKEVSVDCC